MNAANKPRYVFISYVREDADRVAELAQALRKARIRVWLDTDNLQPGQTWLAEIRRAINNDALVFIACFSQNSRARTSTVQWEELNLAVEQLRLRPPGVQWLIPVRFDNVPIPDLDIGGGRTLASLQYVDIFDDDAADGTARLITTVRRIRRQSSASSATQAAGAAPVPKHADGTSRRPSVASTAVTAPTGGPKLLIFEPHNLWRRLLERMARSSFQDVKSAQSLMEAEALIDEQQFAVALIEVRLDISEDGSNDGLRVMERIRSAGDGATSIIVLTGRGSGDILQVVRSAFMSYGASDTVDERGVEPFDLRGVLEQGLTAYLNAFPAVAAYAPDVLRGGRPSSGWEDEMMHYLAFPGIARRFTGFLLELFGEFQPAIPLLLGQGLAADARLDAASALYWSRALGQAVLVCLGEEQTMDRLIAAAEPPGRLIAERQVTSVIKITALDRVKGAVFTVDNMPRAYFRA
jgi:CheY-like chemotaxis protein